MVFHRRSLGVPLMPQLSDAPGQCRQEFRGKGNCVVIGENLSGGCGSYAEAGGDGVRNRPSFSRLGRLLPESNLLIKQATPTNGEPTSVEIPIKPVTFPGKLVGYTLG